MMIPLLLHEEWVNLVCAGKCQQGTGDKSSNPTVSGGDVLQL